VRRLERRAAQAPALIEPVVKAIDAALNALDEARAHLETALRVAEFDPGELERIEERLFALRAARRANIMCRSTSWRSWRAATGRPGADRCRR
jgi:DNA repair protein RecN (Recombination protein N)